MGASYKCDACGQEMAARHFLVNFFWKPVGDTEHAPELFTEKELCPDCVGKISLAIGDPVEDDEAAANAN